MKKNERCVQNIDEKIPIPWTLIFVQYLTWTKLKSYDTKKLCFVGVTVWLKAFFRI